MACSRLGFLGFGEAAFHLSRGLAQEGVRDIFAYDVALDQEGAYRDTVCRRMKDASARTCDTVASLARSSDLIVAAIPANFACKAGLSALPHLRPDQCYVDVSTASPGVKSELGAAFREAGVSFADAAMMGPLPIFAHKVPMLVCGDGADIWCDFLNRHGGRAEKIEGEAGTATKIKLVRSVFMKGLEALFVETFLFARRCGVEKLILESLASTLDNDPFEKTALRMSAADTVHAERRAHEVAESIWLMEELGVAPIMAEAIRTRLERSAATGLREELKGIPPKSFEALYGLWEKKALS